MAHIPGFRAARPIYTQASHAQLPGVEPYFILQLGQSLNLLKSLVLLFDLPGSGQCSFPVSPWPESPQDHCVPSTSGVTHLYIYCTLWQPSLALSNPMGQSQTVFHKSLLVETRENTGIKSLRVPKSFNLYKASQITTPGCALAQRLLETHSAQSQKPRGSAAKRCRSHPGSSLSLCERHNSQSSLLPRFCSTHQTKQSGLAFLLSPHRKS